MIGRKVSEDEEEAHHWLENSSQHVLSSEVFHESGEKFQKAIVRDEGMVKHYLRHIYLMIGMVVGVTGFVKAYQMSFKNYNNKLNEVKNDIKSLCIGINKYNNDYEFDFEHTTYLNIEFLVKIKTILGIKLS